MVSNESVKKYVLFTPANFIPRHFLPNGNLCPPTTPQPVTELARYTVGVVSDVTGTGRNEEVPSIVSDVRVAGSWVLTSLSKRPDHVVAFGNTIYLKKITYWCLSLVIDPLPISFMYLFLTIYLLTSLVKVPISHCLLCLVLYPTPSLTWLYPTSITS